MLRLAQARAPPAVQAMALALVAGIASFCISGTFLTQGFTWPVYILLALTTATARYAREHCPVPAPVGEVARAAVPAPRLAAPAFAHA
jgi:hypothetical protein